MATSDHGEKDIQEYVAGTFEGDVTSLEKFIREHPAAQQLVEEYQLLYATLEQDEIPSLSIDLANKVVSVIGKRTDVKDVFSAKVAAVISILLFISALVFCYNYFKIDLSAADIDQGLLVLFMIACTTFIFAFHFIEVKAKQKKFMFFQ